MNRTNFLILPHGIGHSGPPDVTVWLVGLATIVWAIVVDQGTKLWAVAGGPDTAAVAHNPRYAFGVVGGSVPVLILGTVAVLAVFMVVIVPLAFRARLPAWIPGLVLGGALSNMIDRARFGAVRDFIATRWAIVNVADLFVASGVLILPALFAIRFAHHYRQLRDARAACNLAGGHGSFGSVDRSGT
jgi:Lipoprotein signal peptidase